MAKINGAPIPPAPTNPRVDASFIFISNLYITVDTKFVNNCGSIPYLIFWNVLHPAASKDSNIFLSKSSIVSINNLDTIPIDVTDKVKTPANAPGPVTLINI